MTAGGNRLSWGERLGVLFGAGAFGILLWVVLPPGVVVMNDDFGYLRSVVETIQRGRPWTDDWLAPWSAGFSVLSALAWKVSGSFLFATQAVQCGLSALAMILLVSLLRARQVGWFASLTVAALLLTIPTVFGKQVEYTGVAFMLPCLLGALAATEKGRWWSFLFWWALALATRQNAATWAVLPLFAAGESWWRGARGECRRPLIVWAAGVAVYFLVKTGMNRTHGQGTVSAQLWESVFTLRALELAGIGSLIFVAAAGLSAWLVCGKMRRAPWWAWAVVAVLVGWLGWGLEWHDRVYFEHSRYAGTGMFYLRALLIVAALGWLTRPIRLRVLHCVGGAAALALVCLRHDVWDYYFIDVFVFGFGAVAATGTSVPRTAGAKTIRALAWAAALGAVAWCHGRFALEFKVETDVRWASVALAEKSLRSGALKVQEIRALPFGYVAWELFPASLRRRPDGGTDGENFFDYLNERSAEVELISADGWSRRYVAGRDARPRETLRQERFSLAGQNAEFALVRFPAETGAPAKRALPENYTRPVFPLDDAEWRALILSRR